MAIYIDEQKKLFTLSKNNTSYQMMADKYLVLNHLYYGENIGQEDMSYLLDYQDRGFSGNPYEAGNERDYSLDSRPQEYSTNGVGDYRINSVSVINADGSDAADWRYAGYTIEKGKYAIPGMPALYGEEKDADTLIVELADKVTGLHAFLYYSVWEERDIITRCVKFVNQGTDAIVLTKAASMNLDLMSGDWELMHFHGRHNLERQMENVRKAMRMGAHIGLGSDAGAYLVPHGKGTVDELHYLTKAGVTEEVLQQTEMVEQVILVSFNHALLRQAKQLLPELRVGALVYGELESMLLPPPIIWKDLGLTNGMEDMDAMDAALPESAADEENCSWMTRWMSDKVSMLRANFPGESLNEIYKNLMAQRDLPTYIRSLDFVPEWVSCEYHTAYKNAGFIDKLHEMGIKVSLWTVDTEDSVRSLLRTSADAYITNRPDRVREWMEKEQAATSPAEPAPAAEADTGTAAAE